MDDQHGELGTLQVQLNAEERAYADLLAAVDRLATFALPLERLPEQPRQMGQLNQLWESPAPPPPRSRLWRFAWRRIWSHLAPSFARQQDFNSLLVQVLNGHFDESARLQAHLRDLAAALVRYFQRLLPLIDVRDRVATALGTTRSELILEAYDRRQEALAGRIEGLMALRDRIEILSEELRALRGSAAVPPSATQPPSQDTVYVAFENRYRGSREQLLQRLTEYADLLAPLAPVIDLGCGRGEFLELLKQRGVAAQGVEANAACVQECRARGLTVSLGDLIDFLGSQADASVGGILAAQVAEHLPPAQLQAMLSQARRALRPGGLLVVETVNPSSLTGFLEVYLRDLTHRQPLHPDTLRFLAAAAGFSDVRVEWRAPVEPLAQLQLVPEAGLPPRTAEILNENLARLNGLLYAPLEYALLARR